MPGTATATVDCRLVPETDPEEFFGRAVGPHGPLRRPCEVFFSDGPSGVSEGPLLPLLGQVCEESFPDAAFAPVLCPAFTDSRYFRQLGADAYGLVPVMLDQRRGRHVPRHRRADPARRPAQGLRGRLRDRARACTCGLASCVAGT